MYKSSEINPLKVGYVEAHGTGTLAGDAASTNSISSIFNADGKRHITLLVGPITANIGHLEATRGLAGLIKTVMILEKRAVAPVPNIEHMKDDLNLTSHISVYYVALLNANA